VTVVTVSGPGAAARVMAASPMRSTGAGRRSGANVPPTRFRCPWLFSFPAEGVASDADPGHSPAAGLKRPVVSRTYSHRYPTVSAADACRLLGPRRLPTAVPGVPWPGI